MSIFSKNCVLAGQLDYYCLICAELFKNEGDTLEHIVATQHKNKLKSCPYFEKFKEHFIRKVGSIYFCEPCSQTFPTATKVGLHVDDPAHVKEINKSTKLCLKRDTKDIIAFDKFLVTEEAWNGFVEDTCVLCNAEFDDGSTHKASSNHILNLVASKVIFDDVIEAVYRSIDAKSHQCLTCNIVFGEDLKQHLKTSEHKSASKIYDKNRSTHQTNCTNIHVKGIQNNLEKDINTKADKASKETVKKEVDKKNKNDKLKQSVEQSKNQTEAELDKIYCKNLGAKDYITDQTGNYTCILCDWMLDVPPEQHLRSKHHQTLLKMHQEKIENNPKNKNDIRSNDNKSNLFECVEKYQYSNVNIDLINETAVCKKCSKNIDFNSDAIEEHIEDHKKSSNKKLTEKVARLASGMKSNGTDKTTLYTKPLLRTAGKEKSNSQPVNSAKEVEGYAKQHGLKHNRADNSFYCNPCSRRVPTTLEELTKHVDSKKHKENIDKKSLTIHNLSTPLVKVPLAKFIESFEVTETMTGIDMVINDKYWLRAFDFFLVGKYRDNIVCLGCHIDLTNENVMEHVTSNPHGNIVEKCLVIASLDDEFIREVKLDVYHCGYCNRLEQDWDDVLEHLATQEHKTRKFEAQRRVRNHKPNPYRRVRPKEMSDMFNKFTEHHARRNF